MAYDDDSDEATPVAKKKLSKKDEREILELLDEYVEQALDDAAWKEHREEAVKCFDYKENKQYTKGELAELAERGQPVITNNQVKVTIDRIVGQFVQVKTKTAYKPRNGQDDTSANGMNDIYNYIRQTSGLEYEERDVLEDGATGGFGVFEVLTEEDPDDPQAGGEVLVRHEDCFCILPDPRSRRYDWNEDARFIHRYKWVDQEQLIEMYPAKKTQIKGLFSDQGYTELSTVDSLRGEQYLDYTRKRVRLFETSYKKRENGKDHICIGVHSAGILFEHGKSKRKRYKFVPYFSDRKKNGAPFSRITTALSMQDAINKRSSKALALLTQNQMIYEKGAIADKEEARTQIARPDGIVEIEEGFMSNEKFRVDKNLELAQAQNQMFMQDLNNFRMITGVNPDAMGEKSEIRSGVGIQRKVAMTGLVIAPMFDNFKRTREALAKTIHDAVTVAYTQEKVFTITDDAKITKTIQLGQDDLDAIKQAKYDLIISEEADYDTVQEQQQEMLAKNLPLMLQFGPAWGRVLFQMSSLRNKEEMLELVKQVEQESAKPPEPSLSASIALDKAGLPEKVFYYQKMGMPPELIKMMIEENLAPTQVLQNQNQGGEADKMQAQAEVAKTQLAMQTEQQKAETARVKGEMDMQKLVMEIEAKKMELGFKQQELEMKSQAEQQKMAMDAQGQQMELQGKQQLMAQEAAHKQQSMQRESQMMDKEAATKSRMMDREAKHKTGMMKQQAQVAKAKATQKPQGGKK